jgi:hypothetical protein
VKHEKTEGRFSVFVYPLDKAYDRFLPRKGITSSARMNFDFVFSIPFAGITRIRWYGYDLSPLY